MNPTRLSCWRGPVLAVIATTLFGRAAAETASFKPLRYEEDYSSLRNVAPPADFPGALKFIALNPTGEAWLTLGGESRSRYEYFHHAQWGAGPQDANGYFLQRTMLHADWHPDASVRVFLQLKSGLEAGRTGGPRTTDEDRLDCNQAFVDVHWSTTAESNLTLRAGRQELALGSSRLISTREAPNVRLTFDGARISWEHVGWRVDALAVQPVQTTPGVFDDSTDRGRKLWGLYAVTRLPRWPGANLDVYALGYEQDSMRFEQGRAREKRQTLGSRLWGKAAGWDYNGELVLQSGSFGPDRIEAWMLSLDFGYTLPTTPGKPRLGLKGGVASGDGDPHDGTLGTYNALFPRGAYFHESGLIGPANIIDVHPSLALQLAARTSLSLDCDFFWRQRENDGVYGPAVNFLRPGVGIAGRYLGTQPSIRVEWRPTHHWLVASTLARFYTGEFFRHSGPGANVDYFSSWLTYLF